VDIGLNKDPELDKLYLINQTLLYYEIINQQKERNEKELDELILEIKNNMVKLMDIVTESHIRSFLLNISGKTRLIAA